jgi:hypothetical protein
MNFGTARHMRSEKTHPWRDGRSLLDPMGKCPFLA